MRARRRRPADPARADAGRRQRCGRPRICSRPTSRRRPGRCCSASPPRSPPARCSASPCTCRRRARRALRPLVIGSQAVPVPVIAPAGDPRARLRPGAEGAARRARLLLPGRRSTSTTACATPTPTRASCCARSTRRAGRRCACSRLPSALPATFTGVQDRRRGRGDRRGVRRVGGLGRRARPRAADRQRPARDRRARSPPPCCCSCSPSPSTAPFALLERRVVDWTPAHRLPEDHDPPRCSLLALARRRSLAGCGEKAEPAAGAARARPSRSRSMLDYFPNADHAGLYAAQADGRVRARRAGRRSS